MIRSKFLVGIAIIILSSFCGIFESRRGDPRTKLKGVTCNNSLSLTVYNTTCAVNAYSRNNSVLNLEVYLKRPLNTSSLTLRIIILSRVRSSYGKYLDNSVKELCTVVAGGENDIFDKMIRPFFDTYTPGFLHPCPYFGKLEFNNFSIQNPSDSANFMLPRGDYRFEAYITDEYDANLFNIIFFTSIISDVEM